jgi:hypothetical protein
MFATMLICVGVLLVVSGGIAVVLHRSAGDLAARMLRLRSVTPGQLLLDGPVRIDGIVAAGEEGPLVAPCSGAPVVWFRLRLRNGTASGGGVGTGGSVYLTIVDEHCGTAFLVEHEADAPTLVNATGARFIAQTTRFRELPLGAHDRVQLFLEARGIETWAADLYEEECLRLGDRVTVARLGRRGAASAEPVPYRDARSSRLFIEAEPGQELVVATPEAARAAVGGGYRGGRIAGVVGLVMVVAGVVARWIG